MVKHCAVHHHATTITILTAIFHVPSRFSSCIWSRRELLDFMVQGEINRGRHTDHPAGRHSIRTNQCPPPPPPSGTDFFYRLDVLTVSQPTVSEHWRKLKALTLNQRKSAFVDLPLDSCEGAVPFVGSSSKDKISFHTQKGRPHYVDIWQWRSQDFILEGYKFN